MIIKNKKFTTDNTRVECEGKEEQKFNAPHHFTVLNNHTNEILTEVNFQKGPIKENEINGCANEDVLLMVITRLESFQDSDWACEENAKALEHLYAAIDSLRERTNKRTARGVLGTSVK